MADTTKDHIDSACSAFGEVAGFDHQGLINAIASDLNSDAAGEAESHVAEFLPLIEELELTDAKKLNLLAYVYVIVDTLIRIQFGLDPSQQILGESPENAGISPADTINLSHSKSSRFNEVSAE